MKRIKWQLIGVTLIIAMSFASLTQAQNGYTLSRGTIDNGGGTLTASNFSLTGSIGQPDAYSTLSNGDFTLVGGIFAGNSIQTGRINYLPAIYKN